MRRVDYLAALMLLSCSPGLCERITAQVGQAAHIDKGTIAGRVTLRGKSKPGIVVGLRSVEPGSQALPVLKTTSDFDGNYRLEGVAPGHWVLMPMNPAFVFSDYSVGSTGKTIVIVSGDNLEGVDLALVPGGVITGKVIDSEGQPLIEEFVSLIQTDQSKQAVMISPNWPKNAITDDRGVYRIFGVPAGKYKVVTGQRENTGLASTTRRSYQQTFYPNTNNQLKASIVEITEGSEAGDIDISVGRALESFTVTGQIVDRDTNQPIANLRCGLTMANGGRDTSFAPIAPCYSNSKGVFEIEHLLPGYYVVSLLPDRNAEIYGEPVRFVLSNQDLKGVVIKTSAGASLSGRVVLEGRNDKSFLTQLSQPRLNVYLQSSRPEPVTWRTVAINPDGSFHLGGLPPGYANINVISAADPKATKDLVILHTERDGMEQTRGIQLKANEQVTGLTVVVASGSGAVRGVLKFENGVLPAGSRIMIQLTRTDKTNPLRATDVDARGQFLIEGMPAGTYWLQAIALIPEWRGPAPSFRQPIRIANGLVTEIEVILNMSPNPPGNPRP